MHTDITVMCPATPATSEPGRNSSIWVVKLICEVYIRWWREGSFKLMVLSAVVFQLPVLPLFSPTATRILNYTLVKNYSTSLDAPILQTRKRLYIPGTQSNGNVSQGVYDMSRNHEAAPAATHAGLQMAELNNAQMLL